MSPFSHDFSVDSPVMAMSPQPAHQAPFRAAGLGCQQLPQQAPFGPMSTATHSETSSLENHVRTSRKRSRDEAASNLEPDLPPPKPEEPEEEWVYGPGMVLIKASKGYVADASSQSGTWLEEKKAADEEARRKLEEERPPVRNHKMQRINVDIALGGNTPASPSTSPAVGESGSTIDDTVDDVALHLGIGWKKINDDEHVQAAARGWARYIENHFPVTNAHIRLESKGLQSYLVESSEGFFLFAEDLRQGQLVSTNVEGALRNLRSSPPIFEGANTLIATESPAPATVEADSDMHMG